MLHFAACYIMLHFAACYIMLHFAAAHTRLDVEYLCQWYVSLCMHISTFPCEVVTFLNPGCNTVKILHNAFQDSLEGDEDLLFSNRHPHCLTIFNPGRNRYWHLILTFEIFLSCVWRKDLLSMVGLAMSFTLWTRILVPSPLALTPPDEEVDHQTMLHRQTCKCFSSWKVL